MVADTEALHRHLAESIKELPPQWHTAVEPKYVKERDAKQICKELGITTTNHS